jgi:hypothetical protein
VVQPGRQIFGYNGELMAATLSLVYLYFELGNAVGRNEPVTILEYALGMGGLYRLWVVHVRTPGRER